jgi:polyisoprenoid-binding protein YceI
MKGVGLIFITILYSLNLSAQEKYIADKANTKLEWFGEKVTGQHTGTIDLQSGWINMKDNKIIAGEFIVDMSTIKESQATEKLENHLKSDDFFGVIKFPTAKLVIKGSTSFDKGSGIVRGNLTIKGITNPIEFKATMLKNEEGIRFFANISVDRTKFNIRYGSGSFFDNLGDKIIYDEFRVKVNILVKK